ncbi:MAG: M67 family metallopeptidase [Planctomycetes bacterium]|nr:M67 family metallopeptidase [Planctomycetota bacterium]
MLSLPQDALARVTAHAEADYPRECCGLLLGPAGGPPWRATTAHRAKNLDAERAHDRYLMDPADRLAAEEAARAAGLAVVGFYHSHPDHDAYFSQTDLQRSEEHQWGEPWVPPSYAYLVVSVREGRVAGWKAFVVDEGAAREVPVAVG